MMECIYCGRQLVAEYNFCGNCFKQVRCIQCSTPLNPSAPICLKCGTPLSNANPTLSSSNQAVNKFTLEEQQTETSASRRIQGEFTDEAIDKVAFILGNVRNPITKLNSQSKVIETSVNELMYPMDNDLSIENEEIEIEKPSIEKIITSANVNTIFTINSDDLLVATIIDFKGTNIKEQQSRFILLYIWSYCEILKKPMPNSLKSNIKDSARIQGLYDQNFSTYMNSVIREYCYVKSEEINVSAKGIEQIKLITQEIDDEDIKGAAYWKKSNKQTRRRAKSKDIDNAKIDNWITINSGIDDFDVRNLKTPNDYALFALFIITKKISVAESVNLAEAYVYLTKKFQTISVTAHNFNQAFSRPYNKKRIKKNHNQEYYLTEEGQKYVEDLINSSGVNI